MRDSKSTAGGVFCGFGPQTFVSLLLLDVPVTKSRVSLQCRIRNISFGRQFVNGRYVSIANVRRCLRNMFAFPMQRATSRAQVESVIRFTCYLIWLTTFEDSQPGFLFEDNEAVIRMIIKGRSPNLSHVSRSHRVDLDWLLERINLDSSISIRFVRTTEQGDVDELWTEGDEVFDLTILEVKREFDFGAWDVGAMRFRERELTQMANLEIMIDMKHYKHELQQIEVSKSDKLKTERRL